MPVVTSGVVGVLLDAQMPRDGVSVAVMSMMAASVLVPPTSTPMRYVFMVSSVVVLRGCEDVGFMASSSDEMRGEHYHAHSDQ